MKNGKINGERNGWRHSNGWIELYVLPQDADRKTKDLISLCSPYDGHYIHQDVPLEGMVREALEATGTCLPTMDIHRLNAVMYVRHNQRGPPLEKIHIETRTACSHLQDLAENKTPTEG